MKENGCSDLDKWWQITHAREIQAYGWPSTRLLRRRRKGRGPVWKYGGGLFGDEQTPLGIDYERRLIVANYGKTKIRLDKDRYTKAEKELIRLAVKSLEHLLEESRSREERIKKSWPSYISTEKLFEALLEEAREALKR